MLPIPKPELHENGHIKHLLRCGRITIYDAVEYLCERIDSLEDRVKVLEGKHSEDAPTEVSVATPTITAAYKYDGSEKTCVFSNWDAIKNFVTVTGDKATDAGTHNVIVKLKDNTSDVKYKWEDETETASRIVEWTIAKRTVTLTSASSSRQYNGSALTSNSVTVGGDDWAPGESTGFSYQCTGTITEVGTAQNTFTWSNTNASYKASNYTITEIKGTLTITAVPVYAYYGSSAAEPTEVSTTNQKQLTGSSQTISITTATTDQKKSQWVAVPSGSSWSVTGVVDPDNDSVDFTSKTIGSYVVYHATAPGYINSTYKFTLTKQ